MGAMDLVAQLVPLVDHGHNLVLYVGHDVEQAAGLVLTGQRWRGTQVTCAWLSANGRSTVDMPP